MNSYCFLNHLFQGFQVELVVWIGRLFTPKSFQAAGVSASVRAATSLPSFCLSRLWDIYCLEVRAANRCSYKTKNSVPSWVGSLGWFCCRTPKRDSARLKVHKGLIITQHVRVCQQKRERCKSAKTLKSNHPHCFRKHYLHCRHRRGILQLVCSNILTSSL